MSDVEPMSDEELDSLMKNLAEPRSEHGYWSDACASLKARLDAAEAENERLDDRAKFLTRLINDTADGIAGKEQDDE